LDPQTDMKEVGVSLEYEPQTLTKVGVNSDCVLVSECELTFTAEDWNTLQNINLFADPRNENRCCPITFTILSGDAWLVGNTRTSYVCKQSEPPSSASSWGDPHFLTFDRIRHDFYDVGDFYLVRQRNSEFILQARQDTCAAASCNYGAAVRFRSVVFYVYLSRAGVPSTHLVGDPSSEGVTITSTGSSFTFKTLVGITVSIRVGLWEERNIYYLGVSTRAAATYKQQLLGLYGYYDGDPSNDFMKPDETISPTPGPFHQSWRVGASENLFLNPLAPIPPLNPLPDLTGNLTRQECHSTLPEDDPDDITEKLKSNSTDPPSISNETIPFNPNYTEPTCEITDPVLLSEAKASCDPPFNSSEADCCRQIGISPDEYYATCMCDYKLVGGGDFTYDSVESFFQECQTEAIIQEATCETCPSGCNGNGDCNQGECTCSEGFQGESCDEDWNPPPNTTDITPDDGGKGCTLDVTISGVNFYGTNLSCVFSGTVVPAVKISNFEVKCPLPVPEEGTTMYQVYVSRAGVLSANFQTFTFYESCCENPCLNGASCIGEPNDPDYTCSCAPGFTGEACEEPDDCASNTCQNGATCNDGEGSFTCSCAPGFSGDSCETEEDECESNPCQHGATCVDEVGGYTCECPTGYTGTNCQIPPPFECHEVKLNLLCYERNNGLTTACYNVTAKENPFCSLYNVTLETDCSQQIVSTSPSANIQGSSITWDLQIAPGTTVEVCMDISGVTDSEIFTFQTTGNSSLSGPIGAPSCQVDECQSDPCQNGGTCTDLLGDYSCECKEPFIGKDCETDTTPPPAECGNVTLSTYCFDVETYITTFCYHVQTHHHFSCSLDSLIVSTDCTVLRSSNPTGQFFETEPSTGLTGFRFTANLPPSSNEELCLEFNGIVHGDFQPFTLLFAEAVSGIIETPHCLVDECDPSPCMNGGSCIDGINTFSCDCPSSFYGPTCELQ